MEVDGEGEDTQDAREVPDYGLKPDYKDLEEDEREVSVKWNRFASEYGTALIT